LGKCKYGEALENLEKVMEHIEDSLRGSDCIALISQTLINISVCYTRQGDYNRALEYLKKAL
jgi:tetratricopeptide (TPR) repeat protein